MWVSEISALTMLILGIIFFAIAFRKRPKNAQGNQTETVDKDVQTDESR